MKTKKLTKWWWWFVVSFNLQAYEDPSMLPTRNENWSSSSLTSTGSSSSPSPAPLPSSSAFLSVKDESACNWEAEFVKLNHRDRSEGVGDNGDGNSDGLEHRNVRTTARILPNLQWPTLNPNPLNWWSSGWPAQNKFWWRRIFGNTNIIANCRLRSCDHGTNLRSSRSLSMVRYLLTGWLKPLDRDRRRLDETFVPSDEIFFVSPTPWHLTLNSVQFPSNLPRKCNFWLQRLKI